jgi:hypothetical protein
VPDAHFLFRLILGLEKTTPQSFRKNPTVHVQSWTCRTAL